MTVAQRMTAAEYLARGRPVDKRWEELIDGELVVNSPGLPHGLLHTRLLVEIVNWIDSEPGRGLATVPIDIAIDERNVYAPDIVWYSQSRVPGSGDPAPYAVPDLAIEIRSPSTWRRDIGAKKAGYERQGLPELWLVDDVAHSVLTFTRSRRSEPSFDESAEVGREETLTSPLLPGFELSLETLFAQRA